MAQSVLSDPLPPVKSWRDAIRGNVLAMGLVSLFTDFSSEMMNPLLPVFIAGLVADPSQAPLWVGLMEGVAETTASLLKLYSGRISDRLGKRKALVIIGYGTSSVVRPAMSLVGLLIKALPGMQVVALKFLDRVGKGIRTSPRDALIGDSVPAERRGLAFSFHRAMDHTGAVLGPLVAIGLLYAFLGYARWGPASTQNSHVSAEEMTALRVLFAVAIIPGLAAMAALIFKVREIAPKRKERAAIAAPSSHLPPADDSNNTGRPVVPYAPAEPNVWKQLPRKFYAFVAIVTLFALGNSSDMFLLLYGWKLFGLGLVQLITLWIVLHVSKMVFSIPGGALSDAIGRRPVIVAGWFVYAAVYLGMAFADQGHAWQFWGLFILYGVYFGMTEGAEKALVADFVPSEHRGTAFGIYHGAIGLAALPASLLFGVFWTVVGPKVAFGIGAALAGLAAVLLTVLLSKTRK